MKFSDLPAWIEKQSGRLRAQYPNEDEEKRTYVRTIKLVEEVGELCNEILIAGDQQRPSKAENHDKDNLSHEFADVLIVTLLLANQLGVDVEKALESKIEKINARYNENE